MTIIRKNLSDQIYEILKREILHNDIAFGEKLVNRSLQKRFQVSSTPIRDAINRLYMDGLVEDINNSGAKIIDFELEFGLEVNEFLMALVQSGVRFTFKKKPLNEIIAFLEDSIRLQEENIENDSYIEHDYNFHMFFIESANNKNLKKTYMQYSALYEVLVRNYHFSNIVERRKNFLRQHKKILQAVKDNNLKATLDAFEEHFKAAEILFITIDRALKNNKK